MGSIVPQPHSLMPRRLDAVEKRRAAAVLGEAQISRLKAGRQRIGQAEHLPFGTAKEGRGREMDQMHATSCRGPESGEERSVAGESGDCPERLGQGLCQSLNVGIAHRPKKQLQSITDRGDLSHELKSYS